MLPPEFPLALRHLPSLELRRLRSDLAWCYKIAFGLTVLKFEDFFEWRPAATRTRAIVSNFIKEIAHTGSEL